MNTIKNIKKVALIFFTFTGLTHIISGLMFTNEYFLPYSLIINRILDIPFALTALVYGLSGIYLEIEGKSQKIAGIFFILVTLLIFGGLIYINLLVPDKTSLLNV